MSKSKKEYTTSIFIFHRSLRIDDNTGLITALKNSEKVIPIFIFTPEQITKSNEYRSIPAIHFMIDALLDLNIQLKKYGSKLYLFYGKQHRVLSDILKSIDIDAVYINMDYTPYAIQRENDLANVCDDYGVQMYTVEDYLLLPINSVTNSSGTYYSKYTPYYKKAVKSNVTKPITNRHRNFYKSRTKIIGEIDIGFVLRKIGFNKDVKDIAIPDFSATRSEGLKRVKDIKNHKNYEKNRNDLTLNTTRLSAYIKFGIVSPREVYHKIKDLFGIKHSLISQLYWREFYYNIVYNEPSVLRGKSFKSNYDNIKWKTNKKALEKWKSGQTGVPIVDAGMRELVNSHFMHNRTRLITSNYLTKHLFIDWREGEKFYAENLVDYDPAVNNGNWQWTAGSGSDSQPYFRIMNPWSQAEKYDPECEYIQKWIPELADVPLEDIIKWHEVYENYPDVDYPAPVKVYDYRELKKESQKTYKDAFS